MARSKEDRAALVAHLKELAESADPSLITGHELLDHFSPRNATLILMQLPSASVCAGYKAWQAAGRCVAKGEKGLAILAPIFYSGESQDDGAEVKGFRVVYVFDISQTVPLTDQDSVSDHALELVGA